MEVSLILKQSIFLRMQPHSLFPSKRPLSSSHDAGKEQAKDAISSRRTARFISFTSVLSTTTAPADITTAMNLAKTVSSSIIHSLAPRTLPAASASANNYCYPKPNPYIPCQAVSYPSPTNSTYRKSNFVIAELSQAINWYIVIKTIPTFII